MGERNILGGQSSSQLTGRNVVFLLLAALALYSVWQQNQGAGTPPAERTSQSRGSTRDITHERPAQSVEAESSTAEDSAALAVATIRDQTIRDLEGRVIYRGNVDVGPTLARIARGERLDFSNDGATFQNREGRLPKKPRGYYREFVHPTPALRGPGPQRIVMGDGDEAYYTPDHYRTFRRVDNE